MCGVIGVVYQHHRSDLGAVADVLLRTLEYRGYDSTGAAIQGPGEAVELRKDVGAPSQMVSRLGIDKLAGSILCGQVRWATFGAVDKANAQPHVVRCKTYLYGAHNGNVTNCDELKEWLTSEGHAVASDNDGEMVVHTVEHFFAERLAGAAPGADRRALMRLAIGEAARKLLGSFAAVIVDPISRCLWTIKRGSSLYFGVGEAELGGKFGIASSDLSSVLKLTRMVVPLSEGELVEFDASSFAVYRLSDGAALDKRPVQSRLRAEDTELRAPFKTFMEQEIHAQIETSADVIRTFGGGGEAEDRAAIDALVTRVVRASETGRRVLVLCCGSSFHAAKLSACFFDELAGLEVLPLLPGELRGQYSRSLRDGDLIVAVSQSGETKDLIDALNLAKASGRDVSVTALVNNVSSTLAQEKAELVIPLRCGPEIAVAATKSFVNQLTVLYCLALEVGLRRDPGSEALLRRRAELGELPRLIARTLEETRAGVAEAAELLYLAPSMHILATRLVGVALEGALKIREVVLNHTEGFEASEFKHGRNTILGFNTTIGLAQLVRALEAARSGAPVDLKRAIYADYPLVYVTGPDPRDVDLTVSQINTHKIRGASTVIVAEESAAIRGAASKAPADNPDYRWVYIPLPRTGDTLLTAFSATVVLQSLALAMSLKKGKALDALGVREHGVHPDVPKNVSKSITVD